MYIYDIFICLHKCIFLYILYIKIDLICIQIAINIIYYSYISFCIRKYTYKYMIYIINESKYIHFSSR